MHGAAHLGAVVAGLWVGDPLNALDAHHIVALEDALVVREGGLGARDHARAVAMEALRVVLGHGECLLLRYALLDPPRDLVAHGRGVRGREPHERPQLPRHGLRADAGIERGDDEPAYGLHRLERDERDELGRVLLGPRNGCRADRVEPQRLCLLLADPAADNGLACARHPAEQCWLQQRAARFLQGGLLLKAAGQLFGGGPVLTLQAADGCRQFLLGSRPQRAEEPPHNRAEFALGLPQQPPPLGQPHAARLLAELLKPLLQGEERVKDRSGGYQWRPPTSIDLARSASRWRSASFCRSRMAATSSSVTCLM